MNTVIKDKMNGVRNTIRNAQEEIGMLLKMDELFGELDLSDFSYFYTSGTPEDFSVTFYLSDEHRESKIMHKFAQLLNVSFEKDKTWSEDALVYKAFLPGVSITITGAVPPSCSLVTEEIPLTEDEYQERLKEVTRVRKVTKIICTEAAA